MKNCTPFAYLPWNTASLFSSLNWAEIKTLLSSDVDVKYIENVILIHDSEACLRPLLR